MFIPYAVDAPFDRQPVVNWLVLGGIILVFALQVVTSEKQAAEKPKKEVSQVEDFKVPTVEEVTAAKDVSKKREIAGPMARFALNGWGFGLFTYNWLQGGIIRFIGNLIFLWPFGNAVCARLGNKLYSLIFLGFGLLAGVIHLLLGAGPAVGADSVICGIVGIYIVLFPEDTMSCFVILPRPMAVSISGAWFVPLWFIFDIIEGASSGQSTTYYAHILCAGAGFGLAVLMLKKNWVVMEKDEKSLLQMLAKAKEEVKEEIGEEKKQGLKDSQAVAKPPEPVGEVKAQPGPVGSISGGSYPVGPPAQAAPVAQVAASPQKAVAVAEKPADDFIRFKCQCGHRIKVHKRDAGKAGRCPRCSKWVEAPRQ